jgi:MFS family permease
VLQSGLLMAPASFVMLVCGPLAGLLGNRIGFRAVLAAGTVANAISFAILAVAHDTTAQFIASNLILGVGISFGFASMANLIVGLVDPSDVGVATGINTIMRTVGGAFGAAVVTALLTADTIGASDIPTEHAYTEAFTISIVISVLALLAALWIPRPRRPRRAPVARPQPARSATG